MADCPCLSGKPLEQCCGLLHEGTRSAQTCEELMRARYSAFVEGRIDFIKSSTHPKERRAFDEAATRSWAEQSEWKGLDIVSTRDGGETDNRGMVEFIAHYTRDDEDVAHHEAATFKKTQGKWYFVDGRMVNKKAATRAEPKIGRNSPCPCGSGKKYKKCCGKN